MIKRSILFMFLAACGGAKKAPEAPVAEAAPTAEKAISDFHEVLAPLWHAAPGPARTEDTCKAAPQLATLADTVAQVAQPTWQEQAAGLQTTTKALAGECSGDRAAFDAKFHDVHEAFHRVAETSGGEKH
jgi:hypothetical protein